MLVPMQFKPGVVKDDSGLIAAQSYIDADKMRCRMGLPEVIGGWELANLPSNKFTNPVRGAHAWAALSGDKARAFGTASNLYSFFGGSITDITPLKYKGTLANPFTTTNGSKTVVVAHPDHGLKEADSVTYSLADAIGGLTINGTYSVARIRSLDSYEITAAANATSDATGGGNVEVEATLDVGLVDGTGGTGWGTGTYGSGLYGIPTGGDIYPRAWSCDDWGNNGVFVPRNGAYYMWQPAGTYNDQVAQATASWVAGTGWTNNGDGSFTAVAATASDLSLDLTALISGGLTYEVAITATVSAGTLQFKCTSADSGDTSYGTAYAKTGSYTRRFTAPSNPTTIKFSKDAAFAGTISAITVKLVSKAFRIQSAPQYSIGMFTDPNRIAVCYGTVQYNGQYNAMCVRWSAQEDNTNWVPSDTNLSGEFVLAKGSRIVGAVVTRGVNLVFTDTAVYQMQFTGDTNSVFSFNLLGEGCGLAGKNAVCDHNGMVFWFSSNGNFYIWRGGSPQIIECQMRKDFFDNLAASQNEKIWARANGKFPEIWFGYADARDGAECSRVLAYNYADDHWMPHKFTITEYLAPGIDQYPLGFWTDGNIYYHEKGTNANGATIPWFIKSGYVELASGANMMVVTKFFPDFELQGGNINLDLYFRNYPNQADRHVGPFVLTPTSADINFRASGREMSMEWSAGQNSTFMRLGQQSMDVTASGMKR